MNCLKKNFAFLLMTLSLLLGGCAVSHDDVTLRLLQGKTIVNLYIPYPEPLEFSLPSANWVPMESTKKDGVMSRAELAEVRGESYMKVAIEGQTKTLFESLETKSGVDFSAPDSVVLTGLMKHYMEATQSRNADKPIQYSEIKFARLNGDPCVWMLTSSGSYSVAYAVFVTGNSNFFTVEVDQKNRSNDMEKILLDIIESREPF